MLTTAPLSKVTGDLGRRWMTDDYFDLSVGYEPGGQIHGFQLCYDKPRNERALTWVRHSEFFHLAIDTGESVPTANMTPILVVGGVFPGQRVKDEFSVRSTSLAAEIRDLVLTRLDD